MTNYSILEQTLHKQFLENNQISKLLLDRNGYKANNFEEIKNKNIFITGLARAGTTAVLNLIDTSNKFASLRYKYMPFILSPRLAKLFSNFSNKSSLQKERFHGDGITINISSPECLDEPFWINSTSFYSKENIYISPKDFSYEFIKKYNYFINRYGKLESKKRILIKNNNHHTRLKSLSKYFKESIFLVLFREPLAQSISLLNQNIRFKKLQEKEPFILDYMNMIGHWEFGLNKKPFIYENKQLEFLNDMDDNQLDYWIKQWIFSYRWLLKNYKNHPNIKMICYEQLCNNQDYFNQFLNDIDIKNKDIKNNLRLGKSNYEAINFKYDQELYDEALNLYQDLKLQ